jgi:hypothetical protein
MEIRDGGIMPVPEVKTNDTQNGEDILAKEALS